MSHQELSDLKIKSQKHPLVNTEKLFKLMHIKFHGLKFAQNIFFENRKARKPQKVNILTVVTACRFDSSWYPRYLCAAIRNCRERVGEH